jgi:hypothetical protein
MHPGSAGPFCVGFAQIKATSPDLPCTQGVRSGRCGVFCSQLMAFWGSDVCLSRFNGRQTVQFGADIGHAARDDHAASTADTLAGFGYPQDAQRGGLCGFGCWRGAKCGRHQSGRGACGVARCPNRAQTPRCKLGGDGFGGRALERRQSLEQTGKSKQSDSHVKPFKSMEVGHRQDC